MKTYRLVHFVLIFIAGHCGVSFAHGSDVWSQRVAFGFEDGEEANDGDMELQSSHLDLGVSRFSIIRYRDVNIPQGANIVEAYVQFTSGRRFETNSCSVTIQAEDQDASGSPSSRDRNISTRLRTSASVRWDIPGWRESALSGPDQRTPDLSAVIQEVVSRSGWEAGSSLSLIFNTVSGSRRSAKSFESDPALSGELTIVYSFDSSTGDSTAPVPAVAQWDSPPHALSGDSIRMVATVGRDPSGVEYFFENIEGGGNDSGWQQSPVYIDTDLNPLSSYTYRVKMRDRSTAANGTGASPASAATTTAAGESLVYYRNPTVEGADPTVVDGRDGFHYLFITQGLGSARYESTDMVIWSNKTFLGDPFQAPEVIFDPPSGDWYFYTNYQFGKDSSIRGRFDGISADFGFDQMFYRDADGKQYLFVGGNDDPHEVLEMSDPETPLSRSVQHYVDDWWGVVHEGQIVDEFDGTYYMFLSINGANTPNYRVGYGTGPSPTGPFTFQSWNEASCILRASNPDSIWGPGHHGMIKDDIGTRWIYYQQKDSNASGEWDRRIALDPMWFDASGVPHIRPTRGTSWQPGPNQPPERIWPARDAFAVQEAESYDGSAVIDLTGDQEALSSIQARGYAAYRRLDFGTGVTGFTARFSSQYNPGEGPDSVIEVRLDGVKGPLVGVCKIEPTGGWTQFTDITIPLTESVTGIRDVVLVFQGAEPDTNLMRLDHFRFTSSAEIARINQPPIAQTDTIILPRGGSLQFDVLTNDRDPEGDGLKVTGVSDAFNGGNVQINNDQSITYSAPGGSQWGEDRIFYSISDGNGNFHMGDVNVEVVPSPGPHYEVGGVLIIEAEDFVEQEQFRDFIFWDVSTETPGFRGDGYVTTPDGGNSIDGGMRLNYGAKIEKAGRYWTWARVRAPNGGSDRSWVGFNPDFRAATLKQLDGGNSTGWTWVRGEESDILRAGMHRFTLARGEDGHEIDRFILTDDPNYNPSLINGGLGPRSSTQGFSNPQIDSDEDGISDSFEAAFSPDETSLSPGVDLDGDGLTNLQEYFANTSPINDQSRLHITELTPDPDGIRNTIRWQSAPNRYYNIYWTDDLSVSGWEQIASGLIADPPENVYQHEVSAQIAPGFYRVEPDFNP